MGSPHGQAGNKSHCLAVPPHRADVHAIEKKQGLEPVFREKTGLVLDPYFSGTKLKWIFEQNPHLRTRAIRGGELAFGTIDSWLIYNLTGQAAHVTDYTNASRTLLFNLQKLDWDDELLRILEIPRQVLPEVRPSNDVYGYTPALGRIPAGIAVAGAAGGINRQPCLDRRVFNRVPLRPLSERGGFYFNEHRF